jgi:hypothetical protein
MQEGLWLKQPSFSSLEPAHKKTRKGWPQLPLSVMQQWSGLSGVEAGEVLCKLHSMRDLAQDTIPDKTAALNFRHPELRLRSCPAPLCPNN